MSAIVTQRFLRRPDHDEAEAGTEYCAWLDTARAKFILLSEGKDPNAYVRHAQLNLLFTDQAEYYAVCTTCYYRWRSEQWSGSTHAYGWRDASAKYLAEHIQTRGWCEFCDPVFGNGGWL